MNMMEILKGQLGGMMAEKMGQSLGMDSKAAESGIGALLPTILGGLMKQASTPSGADQLDQTLGQDDFDGGILDNLGDLFGGSGASGGSDMMGGLGGGLVKMLFGDKVGAIADVVSKLTGMKSSSVMSMLTVLAPIVMSFLGKQKRSLGLDAGGMANLLMSQKDEVAKAMPAGMSSVLGLADMGFSDTPAGTPAVTPRAQPQVAPAASGGGGKWLLAIPVVAILGYFGFKAMNPQDAIDGVKGSMEDAAAAVEGMGEMSGEATAAIAQAKEVLGGYQETLTGITNEASATAALPDMESLNEKLGGFAGTVGKLPEGVQSMVKTQFASLLEPIKAQIDKITAIPGVGPILKPVIDAMLEKVGLITAT